MDEADPINAQLNRPRVLVVDQSTIMRRAIAKILDDEYELIEAQSAGQAWDMLQEGSVAVLVMGSNLPDMAGYGLLERVREARSHSLNRLPVAVVAESSPQERQRAQAAGANSFIAKPFDSNELRESLRTLIDLGGQAARAAREVPDDDSSMVDALTGLPNRSYFFYRGPKELSFAQRHGKELALLLIQMDQLEDLIADHGRPVAKQLLRKLAKYVQAAVRTEDTVARVGARRFAVIAPTTNEFGAKEVAERILKKVRQTYFNYADKKVAFTVSMGLAAPRASTIQNFDQLVEASAQRLTEAAQGGGDRLVFSKGSQPSVSGAEPDSDTDAEIGAGLDQAADTGLQTAVRPVPTPVDPNASAEEQVRELTSKLESAGNSAPALEVAMWLLDSGQAEKLRPHYQLLLKEILPLLEHANGSMNLDIGEALGKLRERLSSRGQ